MHNVYTFRARYVVMTLTRNYLSHFLVGAFYRASFFALTALGI